MLFLYLFIHVSLYLDFNIFILLALLQIVFHYYFFFYSDIKAFIPLYFNDEMSITAEQWRGLGFISFKTMSIMSQINKKLRLHMCDFTRANRIKSCAADAENAYFHFKDSVDYKLAFWRSAVIRTVFPQWKTFRTLCRHLQSQRWASPRKNPMQHKSSALYVVSTDTRLGSPTVTATRNASMKWDVNVLNQWLMVACSSLDTPGETLCEAPVGGSCREEDARFLSLHSSSFKPFQLLIIKEDICFHNCVLELLKICMYIFHLA